MASPAVPRVVATADARAATTRENATGVVAEDVGVVVAARVVRAARVATEEAPANPS
jgi:hypothetical protein